MTLRLAFMGTPDFAVPTLAELIAQGHDIACVYSQPPRPKGRGLETEPSPVHKFALASQLAVRTPLTLKDEAQQEFVPRARDRRRHRRGVRLVAAEAYSRCA